MVEEGGSTEANTKDGNGSNSCPSTPTEWGGDVSFSSSAFGGNASAEGVSEGALLAFLSSTTLEAPQEKRCKKRSKKGRRRVGSGAAPLLAGVGRMGRVVLVWLKREVGGGFLSDPISAVVFTNGKGVGLPGGGTVTMGDSGTGAPDN